MNVDVAIGVVGGKVVARWHHAVTQIVFDPDNAFQVGTGLRNAACDATGVTPEMMGASKTELTNEARAKILIIAGKILRSMLEQGKTAEQATVHVVDYILSETTR